MKCAIIAGGMGTRLRAIVGDHPKPMVLLAGIPLLERLIGLCRRFDIVDLHLFLAYRPEIIRDYFGDGSAFGVHLTYWIESEPLGTAGCMVQMLPAESFSDADDDVLVLYGDVFVEMDLRRLIEFHRRLRPVATLVVHPNDHPHDSDLVEARETQVVAFHRKPHAKGVYHANLVNAGVYVLTPQLLRRVPKGKACDFGRDIFPEAVQAGEFLASYNTPEYIKDIGTPERYREVEADLRNGKPERASLTHRRKAIFLDRDGTINVLVPLLSRMEDMRLYSRVAAAIRRINRSDYLAIVVTNQPQIARGMINALQLQHIHNKMETLLGYEGAKLDAIYYCPHHTDSGYPGEIRELKIHCRCRKPETLLYELAAERFHIDLTASAVIGDSTRDLEAARRLGCRAVLVDTGVRGSDIPTGNIPDFAAHDLHEAVNWVIGSES